MKKADRISGLVEQFGATHESLHPCYTGFFECFNAQRYYEAHDVLEHLWRKNGDANYAYYKGLIQVSAAFVHLQKQFLRPTHAKDGRRLHPAVRLFQLALANLESYRPRHLSFDVERLCQLCTQLAAQIVEGDFQKNPWSPERAPQIGRPVL